MSDITTLDNRTDNLFNRISELIEQSRRFAVNAVNVAEVRTRFEVGRYIFEDEQRGERATYGQQVLKKLSARLMEHYGNEWSYDTLVRCRKFYQAYEHAEIVATALPQLEETTQSSESKKLTNWGNGVATIQMPRFTLPLTISPKPTENQYNRTNIHNHLFSNTISIGKYLPSICLLRLFFVPSLKSYYCIENQYFDFMLTKTLHLVVNQHSIHLFNYNIYPPARASRELYFAVLNILRIFAV